MPRAHDSRQPLADWDPLASKLNWNTGDIANEMAAALEKAVELFFNWTVDAFDQMTGLDLSVWVPMIDNDMRSLVTLFGELDPLGKSFNPAGAVETFIGLIASNAEGIATQLPGSLINLTGAGGMLSGFTSGIPILNQLTGGLGGSGFGLPGFLSALQGHSPTVVNVGSLSSGPAPNLFVSPIFTSDALAPSIDWSIDTTSSRTQDGSGSLMVKADGFEHAVRSGITPETVTPVSAGQEVTLSINVANKGYTGFGDPPVQLQIAEYTQAGLRGFVTVDTYTPDGDMEWPGHLMTNTQTPYVVPDGVTGIQARIYISDGALTGTFWFDDGYLGQTGLIKQNQVNGLPNALNVIDTRYHSMLDVLASGFSRVPYFGAEMSDLTEAIANFDPLNVLGPLGGSTIADDMGSIIGHMVDAVKKQPAGTTTNGSLADLYNVMNQAIHNTTGSDEIHFYDTTITVPIPSWVAYIDVVGVGKGQAGEQGETLGFFGQGGAPGVFNAAMWVGGTDYVAGTDSISITFNSDGSVTFRVVGKTRTLTCLPGSGPQSPQFFGGSVGKGPGPYTFNGQNYAGGGNQNTTGAAGLPPGGGGAGGNGVFFQHGGPGGAAGAWLRLRASSITGQVTGADTTPPTAPTPHFVSATNSTITMNATGSVDNA